MKGARHSQRHAAMLGRSGMYLVGLDTSQLALMDGADYLSFSGPSWLAARLIILSDASNDSVGQVYGLQFTGATVAREAAAAQIFLYDEDQAAHLDSSNLISTYTGSYNSINPSSVSLMCYLTTDKFAIFNILSNLEKDLTKRLQEVIGGGGSPVVTCDIEVRIVATKNPDTLTGLRENKIDTALCQVTSSSTDPAIAGVFLQPVQVQSCALPTVWKDLGITQLSLKVNGSEAVNLGNGGSPSGGLSIGDVGSIMDSFVFSGKLL
ncbi:hypothetical protein E6O75_ATG02244 [Venturia nashicola]|uniref:Uncharacterized protein n=1 Tax=Venturia nashicola TaxID=86259 RepID=A0A4Z1PIM2_9PEZI|nr:hypothetical protein E6O75_ATG02244 [Venturia nashicola]